MASICSNVANVVTRWVERNSPYVINTMDNLTYTVVRIGCDWTRKVASVADELIDTTLDRIKTHF